MSHKLRKLLLGKIFSFSTEDFPNIIVVYKKDTFDIKPLNLFITQLRFGNSLDLENISLNIEPRITPQGRVQVRR